MLRLKCAPVLPVILAAALLLLPWGWVGPFWSLPRYMSWATSWQSGFSAEKSLK